MSAQEPQNDPLHDGYRYNGEDPAPRVAQVVSMKRPVIIDLTDGLGACEICPGTRGVCHKCSKPIPVYESMGGAGYQSVRPTHFHLEVVNGSQGRKTYWGEYCLECYREDFTSVYPDLPAPV